MHLFDTPVDLVVGPHIGLVVAPALLRRPPGRFLFCFCVVRVWHLPTRGGSSKPALLLRCSCVASYSTVLVQLLVRVRVLVLGTFKVLLKYL